MVGMSQWDCLSTYYFLPDLFIHLCLFYVLLSLCDCCLSSLFSHVCCPFLSLFTVCRGKWWHVYIAQYIAFQAYGFFVLTSSLFHHAVFLLGLHDHSLKGFLSVIMALSTISHILMTSVHHVLLVWHLIFSPILMVFVHIHSFHVWVECLIMPRFPVLLTLCLLRYHSAVICVFKMSLVWHVISSLSPSLCMISYCGLCCYP